MTHDYSQTHFNLSLFLFVFIIPKMARTPTALLRDCQNPQTPATGLVQRAAAPLWTLTGFCACTGPAAWEAGGKRRTSLPFLNACWQLQSPARSLASQLHMGDSPEDNQPFGECIELTVSDQDKLHTMLSRSCIAPTKLELLSEDLPRKKERTNCTKDKKIS